MNREEIEKMFLELNSALVKFWKEQGRPDKEIKIELLERMLHWYKKMGYVTLDKQELEVDLEKEIDQWLDGPTTDIRTVARHFYELGCRRTAEKYDEIEYNRQMAEERQMEKEIPNDLEKYASRAGFDYVDNIVQEHPGHRFNDHDVEFAYRDGIIAGAKRQAEQDKETIELAEDHAYLAGAVNEREKMMKEAVVGIARPDDCEIWVNLVGYGYKFNEGDKVRIIIVKEN